MSLQTYTGSCHCGAVRFEAELDLDEGSNRCNCSYCAKVRAWFAFAKGEGRFRLIDGSGVSEYRWTPPGDSEPHLTFSFCRTCGVWGFAEPIAVVAREAWFSRRVLRYEIETNAGMLGTKARFVIDAESGAIQSEGYILR